MAKIQDIDIPYLEFAEAAAPGTPAAGIVRQYAKSDGLLYSKDDAGAETLVSGGAGGGSVATDAIWDAAGDLAVGSGANTAARLAIGDAGGKLSRINGAVAWDAGTAFPTAASGDVFHRTDLSIPYWRYDGTRWRCTCVHELHATSVDGISVATTRHHNLTVTGFSDVWLVDWQITAYVSTTNTGAAFWSCTLHKLQSGTSTATTIGSALTTAAQSPDQYIASALTAIGALMNNGTTHVGLDFAWSKTGSPGSLFGGARARYQFVAT